MYILCLSIYLSSTNQTKRTHNVDTPYHCTKHKFIHDPMKSMQVVVSVGMKWSAFSLWMTSHVKILIPLLVLLKPYLGGLRDCDGLRASTRPVDCQPPPPIHPITLTLKRICRNMSLNGIGQNGSSTQLSCSPLSSLTCLKVSFLAISEKIQF